MDFETLSTDSLTDVLLQTPIADLTQLCTTNKRVQQICASDSFWQKRLLLDFPKATEKPAEIAWKDWYINVSEFKIDLIRLESDEREEYITEEVLPEVFKQLKLLEGRSNDPAQMYFSGEGDSNQGSFEHASNHLELGVISTSKFVALILLRFVRIVFDEREDLFDINLFDHCYDLYHDLDPAERAFCTVKDLQKVPVALSEFLHILSKQEATYMSSFGLSDEFSVKLGSGKRKQVIKKRIHQVDVWTLPRIEKAFAEDLSWS